MMKVYRITLLEVVQAVQDSAGSDAEAVAVIGHMIRTGRIVLTGILGGKYLLRTVAA